MIRKSICVVAIVKHEEPFLNEWIIYHRMLGVDHFFIYDDDPLFLLKKMLTPHCEYVTVINWSGLDKNLQGRNNQTKAYTHALENYIREYEWVAFIDADEFIVLPAWDDDITRFLNEFSYADAILLNWHIFGHNGYYDDPKGLITASLTRRKREASINIKSITRTKVIIKIITAHFCHIVYGIRVDANHHNYSKELYEGVSKRAHINHYQCRSFTRWMARVERGDVSLETGDVPKDQQWRYDSELCLKQFVTTIARDKNEYIDDYMLRFKSKLEEAIAGLGISS